MTKQELLNDLLSKLWCDSLNGEPQLQEVKVDGGKWYNQNIREVQSGTVAVYRNIPFYAVDEGLATEAAYYKDAVPDTITTKVSTFTDKVNSYVALNTNVSVEKIDEAGQFAIVSMYVEEELGVSEKRYLIKEIDEVMVMKEII